MKIEIFHRLRRANKVLPGTWPLHLRLVRRKKRVSFSIKSFKSTFQLKIPPLPTITEQVRLIFYLELKLQKNIVFKT